MDAQPARQCVALPTYYEGHIFRSRTEARWAVFLDAIGVPWEYEREGFDIDGVRYLPDFRLPTLGAFLEVKGAYPTPSEREKCSWLAEATKDVALIVWGEPCPPAQLVKRSDRDGDQAMVFHPDWDDQSWWWCECPYCGLIDLTFQGRAERLRCRCVEVLDQSSRHFAHDTPRLLDAYAAARRAFTGPNFHGQPSRYDASAP